MKITPPDWDLRIEIFLVLESYNLLFFLMLGLWFLVITPIFVRMVQDLMLMAVNLVTDFGNGLAAGKRCHKKISSNPLPNKPG